MLRGLKMEIQPAIFFVASGGVSNFIDLFDAISKFILEVTLSKVYTAHESHPDIE